MRLSGVMYINPKKSGEFEVEDDCDDDEIDEIVEDEIHQRIEWFWEPAE